MSERQRLIVLWSMPVVRVLLLLFLIFFAMYGSSFPYIGFCGLVGHIGE